MPCEATSRPKGAENRYRSLAAWFSGKGDQITSLGYKRAAEENPKYNFDRGYDACPRLRQAGARIVEARDCLQALRSKDLGSESNVASLPRSTSSMLQRRACPSSTDESIRPFVLVSSPGLPGEGFSTAKELHCKLRLWSRAEHAKTDFLRDQPSPESGRWRRAKARRAAAVSWPRQSSHGIPAGNMPFSPRTCKADSPSEASLSAVHCRERPQPSSRLGILRSCAHCTSSADCRKAHDTHRHFSDTPSQFPIACSHNVAFVGRDTIDEAVIRVSAFVTARKTFKPRIARDSQCDTILGSQLFQLCHHAIRDARNAWMSEVGVRMHKAGKISTMTEQEARLIVEGDSTHSLRKDSPSFLEQAQSCSGD